MAEIHNVGSTFQAYRTNTQLLLQQPDTVRRGQMKITLRDDYMKATMDGQMVVKSQTDDMFQFHHSTIYMGINRSIKERAERWGSGLCALNIKFLGEIFILLYIFC